MASTATSTAATMGSISASTPGAATTSGIGSMGGVGVMGGIGMGVVGMNANNNNAMNTNSNNNNIINNQNNLAPPIGSNVTRHTLKAECELRIEVPFGKTIESKITLQQGSCELWGVELALGKTYSLGDGLKLAFFTWHGCIIDIDCDHIDISYTSEETNSNVAFVNTHAQLEALRDEAIVTQQQQIFQLQQQLSLLQQRQRTGAGGLQDEGIEEEPSISTILNNHTEHNNNSTGPRVLIVGPPESGKSSLAKILIAYATKLGRIPLLVDLDPADNTISVPGSVSVVPMTSDMLTIQTQATGGIPVATPLQSTNNNNTNTSSATGGTGNNNANTNTEGGATDDNTTGVTSSSSNSANSNTNTTSTPSPLVFFHGSTTLQPDLFKSQVSALANKIDDRYKNLMFSVCYNNINNNNNNSTGGNNTDASSGAAGTTGAATPNNNNNNNNNNNMMMNTINNDLMALSSGMIVNTNGWIQDEGYQLLLYTIEVLRINTILIMGHDRLYSMMTNHFKQKQQQHEKEQQQQEEQQQQQQQQDPDNNKSNNTNGDVITAAANNNTNNNNNNNNSKKRRNNNNNNNNNTTTTESMIIPKIIKLPRSGGTVSREKDFLRQARSRNMKRYFYGDLVPSSSSNATDSKKDNPISSIEGSLSSSMNSNEGSSSRSFVPQLTPYLLQVSFESVKCYKLSSIGLSKSLLPVGAAQSTEALQVSEVFISEKLQHTLLAVCHPNSILLYEKTQKARDLYEYGVAGFVAVERVVMDTETLHLLCPCAGSLPSNVLLVGDLTWME